MAVLALLGFLALFLLGWVVLWFAVVLAIAAVKIAFVVLVVWVVWKALEAIF